MSTSGSPVNVLRRRRCYKGAIEFVDWPVIQAAVLLYVPWCLRNNPTSNRPISLPWISHHRINSVYGITLPTDEKVNEMFRHLSNFTPLKSYTVPLVETAWRLRPYWASPLPFCSYRRNDPTSRPPPGESGRIVSLKLSVLHRSNQTKRRSLFSHAHVSATQPASMPVSFYLCATSASLRRFPSRAIPNKKNCSSGPYAISITSPTIHSHYQSVCVFIHIYRFSYCIPFHC